MAMQPSVQRRVFAITGAAALIALSPRAWLQPSSWTVSDAAVTRETAPTADVNANMLRGGAPSNATMSSPLAAHMVVAATLLGAASALYSSSRRRGTTARAVSMMAVSDADSIEPSTLEAPAEAETVDVSEETEAPIRRREVAQGACAAALAGGVAPQSASAEETVDTQWVQYDLNSGETLYDVDFDPENPKHGFIVGAHGLFYESKDGGKRWVSRSFQNLSKGADESQYRFQTVSVRGNEVWIVGKPPLLLHSKNSGKSWKKVPLSKKLPGEPKVIVALGEGKAELATSSGAVYVTDNDGKNWSSQVRETVDATLNRVSSSGVSGASYFTGSVKSIKRDANGKYLAVAQRGNFYLTFTPGEPRWTPHNRATSRRIQAMGFRETAADGQENGAWMSLNGGLLQNCGNDKYSEMGNDGKNVFEESKIKSGGIGIIDLAYRTDTEAWAVGGSGVIYVSTDSGKTWQFDKTGDELPCNLYNVKFFDQGKVGFMIGSNGILLRKQFAV